MIDTAMAAALKNKMKSKKDEAASSFGLDKEPLDPLAHPGVASPAKEPLDDNESDDAANSPDGTQEESAEGPDEKKQELLDAVDALASTPKEGLEEAIANLKDMIEQAY